MTKVQKKQKNVSKGQKYDRQKLLNAERVKKFRKNMTEEQWEEKRRKDRERYRKKKEQNLVKSIGDLSERDKRKKRKIWRKNSKKYRMRKNNESRLLAITPPLSDNENDVQVLGAVESVQKKRGRKKVKKEKAKAYRTIKNQEKKIKGLERLVKKYQKRLERKETEKLKSVTYSPSPNKKVNMLLGKEKVSPTVKKRLFIGYALEKQLKTINKKTSPRSKNRQIVQKVIGSKILRQYRVQKYLSNIISYKYNRHNESQLKYTRKKHLSTSKIDLNTKLAAFYEDDTISKMCPGKKDFKKNGKLKVQRRILLDTLKNLYKRFTEESGCHIAYSTFARARPFWVTHPTAKDRDTCACIVHSNTDLMVFGLHSIKTIKVRTGKQLLESIVCSVKKVDCMTNDCRVCKEREIPFVQGVEEDINLKIYQWRVVNEKRNIKGQEKFVKRMVKHKEVIKLGEAKKRLKIMLDNFKKHVFNLMHQAEHKNNVRRNLSGRELMIMIDFSENYTAKYQTEVQSMHFGASKKQITLHTVVCYYNNGEKVVPRSFCTVSDHLAHQAFAVWAHLDPVLENLAKDFSQTAIIHFFSDSPTSQYRNRTNLYLLEKKVVNYFPLLRGVTWNFSEPGHGKGAMDGVGGALKRRADELVLHGQDITRASDFVRSFEDSKINVIEITDDKVEELKAFVGPLKIAQVSQITKMKQVTISLKENKMFGRTLSCAKCNYYEKCSHHHLSIISTNVPPTIVKKTKTIAEKQKVKGTRKLKVNEVWSSDDDSEPSGCSVAGPSNTNDDVPTNFVNDISNIKIGSFLLIRFENDSKTKKIHQFVGVCQEVDSDIKVTFLKNVNSNKNLFSVDDNDVSFISVRQVVAVLPPPSLLMKGNRLFYQFMTAINVF